MPDANGVEALEGETEAEYVARQTRLREEAAARMRAKFGGSGGLNGGMHMGGIGSGGSGSGGGGWGLGGSLSALGGSLSSLAATAVDAASVVKEVAKNKVVNVRESLQEKASFDAGRDLAHLSARGSGGALEGSKDLSDLLGGCSFDQQDSRPSAAPPAAVSNGFGRSVPASNGWDDDDAWGGTPAASKPAKPTFPSDISDGAIMAAPAAPVAPAAPPSAVHFSGATGATPKKKVAAVKSDAKWDDWGDDKW